MNCRKIKKLLIESLIPSAPETGPTEHLSSCADCSRGYEQASRVVEMLKPEHRISASPDFEDRVMKRLEYFDSRNISLETSGRSRKKIWIPAVAAAVLALLFLGIPYLHRNGPNGIKEITSHPLLAQATAAERDILDQGGIVHIIKEVSFHPVSDSMMAKMRGHFIPMIGADGEMVFNQLSLPDNPARGFTVHNDSWYDPSSKRFASITLIDDDPFFINSFDGEIVRTTEAADSSQLKIVEKKMTGSFTWPEELNRNIGVYNDVEQMLERFDEENISEAGEGTLEDGTQVRLVKAETVGPEGKVISSCLIKIRKTDNTFAEMDLSLKEEKIMTLRFDLKRPVAESSVPWSLDGIDSLVHIPGASIQFDMMKPDVSVRQMLDNVDFPAYLIHPEPPGTLKRETLLKSLYNPAYKRTMSLCFTVFQKKDDRHLVLVQINNDSRNLGAIIKGGAKKDGTKAYTSPHGFELWSTPKDDWNAKNMLRGARGAIPDMGRPAKDCSGYIIITPDGPAVMLAINGRLGNEELHRLVDNLVLVDEFFGARYLESGQFDPAGETGRLALFAAVARGMDDKVTELLDAGVDPNTRNPQSKMSALWLAGARGKVELVKTLLAAGANVSSEEPYGGMPFLQAVSGHHAEIAELLLEAGADVNSRNGRNPLFTVAGTGDSVMVRLLIKTGADLEAANKDGTTPLMYTAKRGHTTIVKILIDAGANVNAVDNNGRTLLMHSFDFGEYVEVARLLIAAGADVNAAMPDGWTVLEHAEEQGHAGIVALLKESGATEKAD
jgi:ankyrin repeat protein